MAGGSPSERAISRCAMRSGSGNPPAVKRDARGHETSGDGVAQFGGFQAHQRRFIGSATTTIDFASPSAPSEWSINLSLRARVRQSTRPLQCRLWPAGDHPQQHAFPDAAARHQPARWPLPMVSRPLIAFTPTSSVRPLNGGLRD